MIDYKQLGIPEKEFKQFLNQYKVAQPFAAIKVGGECLTPALAGNVRDLYDLGLLPIVVHGGGKQIEQTLKAKGITTEKIDGIRITDNKTLEVVVETLTYLNSSLVSAINPSGKNYAQGFNGVFYAEKLDDKLGLVGKVTGINDKQLKKCLEEKRIPVISSLGKDSRGNYYNINADSAFMYLVSHFSPKKVIFLTPTGGVLGKDEKIISFLSRKELVSFMNSELVNGGMKVKLKEVEELLSKGHQVQITSPENLIKELFTEQGCGTFFYR